MLYLSRGTQEGGFIWGGSGRRRANGTANGGFANVHFVAPVASEKDPAGQAKHSLAPGPGE